MVGKDWKDSRGVVYMEANESDFCDRLPGQHTGRMSLELQVSEAAEWQRRIDKLTHRIRNLEMDIATLKALSPAAGESAPISPEVPQAHGLATPATPSAAVGSSEPAAGGIRYDEIADDDTIRENDERVWISVDAGPRDRTWMPIIECRRKDLPVVPEDRPLPQPWNSIIGTPSVETALRQFVEWHDMDHENMTGVEVQSAYDKVIADAKAALQDAPAAKPRMRQVTLMECECAGGKLWGEHRYAGFENTGRTAVVEVPE